MVLILGAIFAVFWETGPVCTEVPLNILGYAMELPGRKLPILKVCIGHLLPQNPLEKDGVEAPHLFN